MDYPVNWKENGFSKPAPMKPKSRRAGASSCWLSGLFFLWNMFLWSLILQNCQKKKSLWSHWHSKGWQLKWSCYRAPALSWETRRGWGSGPRRWCSDPRKPVGKQTQGVRSAGDSRPLGSSQQTWHCQDAGSRLHSSASSTRLSNFTIKSNFFPFLQMTGLPPNNITPVWRSEYQGILKKKIMEQTELRNKFVLVQKFSETHAQIIQNVYFSFAFLHACILKIFCIKTNIF